MTQDDITPRPGETPAEYLARTEHLVRAEREETGPPVPDRVLEARGWARAAMRANQ